MQPQDETLINLTMLGAQNDESWPLSGELYHGFVITKRHLAPKNILILPVRITSLLPSIVIPAFLSYGGKRWVMAYHGNRISKALDSRAWKKFAIDNCLRIGDACVFDVIECSRNILRFRVQILRGDIPLQLRDKLSGDGESKDMPILID